MVTERNGIHKRKGRAISDPAFPLRKYYHLLKYLLEASFAVSPIQNLLAFEPNSTIGGIHTL